MQETDALKAQVDELCAKFAAERLKYEALLNPESNASPPVEELTERLGEQRCRVGTLQHQLDDLIAKLTSLQETIDTADEGAAPFTPPNERDDHAAEDSQTVSPCTLFDQSPYRALSFHRCKLRNWTVFDFLVYTSSDIFLAFSNNTCACNVRWAGL